MTRAIEVCLGDAQRPVGTLRYNHEGARESASFEYHPTWLGASDRFPIDPTLRLIAGPQFHRKTPNGSVFHAAIADTEPDGWARRVIMRDHARRRSEARQAGEERAPLHGALDFLLEVDDVSRVGALRFRDEAGVFRRAQEPGRRGVPPLLELGHLLAATRAVETNTESAADLAYLRGRGTSLGGLRPKCSVVDDEGHLSIGKFPSTGDERPVTKGEVLAMQLATDAGIDAAEARLVFSGDIPVALIRRFDRGAAGRIMYVSAATMLGAEPDDASDHSYTEIVDALRIHGADPKADIEELWRRIAFSILVTNVDDHLHNHGFLHVEGGRWRLAPAFDLNPFPDRARELKTWISEDSGPRASVDALMEAAPYFQLTSSRAREILAGVERAVARWRSRGRAIGMTQPELEQFADAFEHEEREVARRTATGT
ncbi:MAG TPA: type II toxin-antitoxin system HipA family toxin [Longimicrobium sp.]|jgi:serine/threonine-protein kinase HipA|nr:type II toxin-antitoxin system HipA family toxin [Longimicrobium sp.]